MVVLLHFLTSTEGRTISPRTGSLSEDPKVGAKLPIQSIELSTESCSHTQTHTRIQLHAGRVAGMPQRSKSKYHCRGGKSVPGNETQRRKSRRRRTRAPFGERLSYCVSFMQQGKVQESVAHPLNRPFSLHFPLVALECRAALRGVMESVPGFSTSSLRDVAPRRAVTALRLRL
jgi:hypothetical protein